MTIGELKEALATTPDHYTIRTMPRGLDLYEDEVGDLPEVLDVQLDTGAGIIYLVVET